MSAYYTRFSRIHGIKCGWSNFILRLTAQAAILYSYDAATVGALGAPAIRLHIKQYIIRNTMESAYETLNNKDICKVSLLFSA